MFQHREILSNVDLERLMEIAGSLRDITLSSRHHARIAPYLANTLHLQSLAFAMVHHSGDSDLRIVTIASHQSSAEEFHPERPDLARRMLELADQFLRDGAAGTPAHTECELSGCSKPGCSCRQLVLYRKIDANHMLLIMLREQEGQPPIAPMTKGMLSLIGTYLANLLKVTVEYIDSPQKLGKPFEKLTAQEWRVLCAMESEDAEKQIAQRLGLSPHTLHSNIKTIYRKMGVGARLAVLQKVEEARYEYRMRSTAELTPLGAIASSKQR